MIANSRSIVFVLNLDGNLELIRGLNTTTSNRLSFCFSIIPNSSTDFVLFLCSVIQRHTGFYRDGCILIIQLADTKQTVKSSSIRTSHISIASSSSHHRISVRILISFVGNICNYNRATRYRMIKFIHSKHDISSRRLIINRNNIHSSRVFRRCVTTSRAITDNFILEGSVIITKFIGCSLVRKFAKVSNSNSYTRASRSKFCTIQNQGTLIRKGGYDNRSKRLRSMLEFEFFLIEFMQFIFVNIKSKCSLNSRDLIITYNVNFISFTSFIIRCSFSTFKICNLEPEGFACFHQAIDQRLDNNSFSFGLSRFNSNASIFYAANRECMRGIFSPDISMSSKFTMNTIFRLESKAIIKSNFSFRRLIYTNVNSCPSIIFWYLFRFFTQYGKLNFVFKRFKDKVFCMNFVTNFNFISDKLSRKNHIASQFYRTLADNRTHNRDIICIIKADITIDIYQQIAFIFFQL